MIFIKRWAGHVSRMEVHRLPKIVLYGKLSTGHRDRGAPKKRFKDLLKKSLSACHIDHRQWSALAADREVWRHAVHQSVSSIENNHRAALEEKRSRGKNRIVSAPTLDLPQVVLSQEEKETEHKALGRAREACDRASKCERSEAQEACTTCFACRKSNRVTSLWREASCCFQAWARVSTDSSVDENELFLVLCKFLVETWNWTSRKLSKYQSDQKL